MYVYKQTEPGLYTVGFYDPSGKWFPESDHEHSEDAAKRAHYLNGGSTNDNTPRIEKIQHQNDL